MAIPDNYIDKITKGNDSRMISPAADMVRVNNDNFEGETLDEVLDEVAQDINEAGSGAVSVTTNQDGTFVIHVGETDYTINLNHTHPNMVKMMKFVEGDEPESMEDDTIYVQVDDLQAPSVIEKLYLFGLAFEGGGGVIDETPRLTSPAVGTEIDFLGQSSTTLRVKGLYLGAQLTIAKTGDLAVTDGQGNAVSTISATDANNGIELTIAKGTNYTNEGASLTISSGEVTRTVVVKDSTLLPNGLFADKAWATYPYQAHQKPVELSGYCITKFFFTERDSNTNCNVTVHSGVTTASSGLGWLGTGWNKKGADNTAFDEDTTDARNLSTDPRNFVVGSGDGTCISATFKTSEIANCYIYDHIAGKYLWAGENVDQTVVPPIPS